MFSTFFLNSLYYWYIWITICRKPVSPAMERLLPKSPVLPFKTGLLKGVITCLQAQWQAIKVARGSSTWHTRSGWSKGWLLVVYNHLRGSYGEDGARLTAGAAEQGRRQRTEAGTQETPEASLFCCGGDQTLEQVLRDVVALKILKNWLDESTWSLPTCIILCSWYSAPLQRLLESLLKQMCLFLYEPWVFLTWSSWIRL